jgi:hypothetical protein
MMHWTQRPENKAKLSELRAKGMATRAANRKKKLKETTKRLTPRPYHKKVNPATMIGTAMSNVSDFFGGLTANEIVNLRNESPELISQIKKIKQLLECF